MVVGLLAGLRRRRYEPPYHIQTGSSPALPGDPAMT
jgi:hypothetical protein